MLWFNELCELLGLFDGARPVSPESVWRTEVKPTIEALKANNPEAAVLVEENRRVYGLWRDALRKLADANLRADGFRQRWDETETARILLLSEVKHLREQKGLGHAGSVPSDKESA